jgi:hypothetical protein
MLVKAIPRDWLCSASKRSGKTKHFAGRCCSNPGSVFSKPTKINYTSFFAVRYTTFWRSVHNHLHPHAYKVQIVQALKPGDKPHHLQFAKDILSNIEADENYLRRWIFGDETMFYALWRVNCDCRIWGSGKPHAIREI